MGNRRQRQVARRAAVHECRRSQRRLGHRTAIDEQAGGIADPVVGACRQFHDQVVRVLAIDQRRAVGHFAGREQVGVAARTHCRLQAGHAAQLEVECIAQLAIRHQHRHRLDKGLTASARAALLGSDAPGIAVRHQHPPAGLDHRAAHRTFTGRIACSAGALVVAAVADRRHVGQHRWRCSRWVSHNVSAGGGRRHAHAGHGLRRRRDRQQHRRGDCRA